jgi:hypothetical protein
MKHLLFPLLFVFGLAPLMAQNHDPSFFEFTQSGGFGMASLPVNRPGFPEGTAFGRDKGDASAFSWRVGLHVGRQLGARTWIKTGFQVNKLAFRQVTLIRTSQNLCSVLLPCSPTNIDFTERTNEQLNEFLAISSPLTIRYELSEHKRFRPFLEAGFGVNYHLRNRFDRETSDGEQELRRRDILGPDRLRLSATVGGGLIFIPNRFFQLFTDLSVSRQLQPTLFGSEQDEIEVRPNALLLSLGIRKMIWN